MNATSEPGVVATIGADVVARVLRELGAGTVFTVSGNHNLTVLHALETVGVRVVHCRHETGAVYMAEGWARVTGKPGVCLVTAGPGHTSAITGLASAYGNESPVLCLSAQAPLGLQGQGSFQEMDQVALAAPVTKYADVVRSVGELATAVTAGWAAATEPVPGPVVLSLPTDVLSAQAEHGVPEIWCPSPPEARGEEGIPAGCLETLQGLLDAAGAPLLVVRPSLALGADAATLTSLRERLPVLVSDSPRGLNDPLTSPIRTRIENSDLLILLGPADFTVRYGRINPDAPLIQVTSQRDELIAAGRTGRSGDLLILGEERTWLRVLASRLAAPHGSTGTSSGEAGSSMTDQTHAYGVALHPREVCEVFRSVAGREVAGAMDGGEFGQWVRAGIWDTLACRLGNGTLGAIGGAIPQAVGMALADPGRPTVAFVGDGTFGYYAAEIDTAVRENVSLLVIIGNDSRWSAEWHLLHEAYGPGSTGSTELSPRAYELVAQGYGARGHAVRSRQELQDSITEFLQSGRPGVQVLNVSIRSVPSNTL